MADSQLSLDYSIDHADQLSQPLTCMFCHYDLHNKTNHRHCDLRAMALDDCAQAVSVLFGEEFASLLPLAYPVEIIVAMNRLKFDRRYRNWRPFGIRIINRKHYTWPRDDES